MTESIAVALGISGAAVEIALAALLGFALGTMLLAVLFGRRHGRELAGMNAELRIAEERLARALDAQRSGDRQLEALGADRDALIGLRSEFDTRMQELARLREEVERLRAENAELLGVREASEARLEEQQKANAERLQQLEDARTTMRQEFEHLAAKMLEERGKLFAEQHQERLTTLLSPFRDELKGFRERIERGYETDVRERADLRAQIAQLQNLNQQISQDANNLVSALKGESKTQGNWGEVVLERVFEESGLRKGHEYEVQFSGRNEEGAQLRPDAIVRLPDGKDVIVDSKVSLTAYERYHAADADEDRAAALKEHVASLRRHVKGLGEKSYQDIEGIRTVDFVLMFVPVESAFFLAVEQDRALFGEAMERNVILVCPSTLLATLRTIHASWRYEYQNRNAEEIARRAGNLLDKFTAFVEDLDKVGEQLDRAQQAWGAARGKLSTGRGNLLARAQKIQQLGVKGKKALPEQGPEEDGEAAE